MQCLVCAVLQKRCALAGCSHTIILSFFGGGGSSHDKLPKPHGTRELSRNQGSEPSNATIGPQRNMVADRTRSEDEMKLMPGIVAGTAHTHNNFHMVLPKHVLEDSLGRGEGWHDTWLCWPPPASVRPRGVCNRFGGCRGGGGAPPPGQQKQSNDPGNNQHILNTPIIGRR